MSANTNEYKIQKINCEKDTCQKTFNVVVSPIYSVVTRPVSDINLEAFGRFDDAETETIISDYIVVNCSCGQNTQRVYLKKSSDE